MDIVKSVTMELRPRLRCCNIFLSTSYLLSHDKLTITIRPEYIVFSYRQHALHKTNSRKSYRKYSTSSCDSMSESEDEDYLKFIRVRDHCQLVPDSLTGLKIEKKSVSFRVLTEPSGSSCFGSFHSEVVNGNDFLSEQKFNIGTNTVNVKKDMHVTIHCSNCSNTISAPGNLEDGSGISFKRVLELPSDSMDMSDWFCHAPGKSCSHEPKNVPVKSSNYNKCEPSNSDIFYGVSYFVINSTIINNSLLEFNTKRRLIHCNRCLSSLGSKTTNNDVLKFWNAQVKFTEMSSNVSYNMFTYNNLPCKLSQSSVTLHDTFNIVKYSIRDSSIGYQMPTTCKIILQTELENQYLFLWVLDKYLDVLQSVDKRSSGNDNTKEIKLMPVKAAKVLYMHSDKLAPSGDEDWNGSDVHIVTVSKQMLVDFASCLVDNSKSIPDCFKKTSCYYVSYVYL